MTRQEAWDKIFENPLYAIYAMAIVCITIMSMFFCFAYCVGSCNRAEEARYKYRAIERETFFNKGTNGKD